MLSRGLISGHWSADRQSGNDFRHTARGSAVTTWIATWRSSRGFARSRPQLGVSVAQVAIAWVGAQGDDVVPLVGARRRERLSESLGAVDVQLSDEQLAAIEEAVPKGAAAGDRYDATQMAMLDSDVSHRWLARKETTAPSAARTPRQQLANSPPGRRDVITIRHGRRLHRPARRRNAPLIRGMASVTATQYPPPAFDRIVDRAHDPGR